MVVVVVVVCVCRYGWDRGPYSPITYWHAETRITFFLERYMRKGNPVLWAMATQNFHNTELGVGREGWEALMPSSSQGELKPWAES